MMLNKEECEKAVEEICQLCREKHFLKYGKKGLLCAFQTFDSTYCNKVRIFKRLIIEHFPPQAYKFEELHEGMQVWNEDYEMRCKIDGLHIVGNNENRYSEGDKLVSISVGNCSWTELFEENRFFPITKALEYQNVE